jgi:molybdenum cofactor synthesis domain-containing protein
MDTKTSEKNKRYPVAVITASDKGSRGEREDRSGPLIQEMMGEQGYEIVSYKILPDEKNLLKEEMIRLADSGLAALVLTTGGTGFSPRDITPEATLEIADRNASGIAEAIRANSMAITKRAMLSRAVSVIRGKTLIINLPGSPKAVRESLEFIIDTLPHALEILSGKGGECGSAPPNSFCVNRPFQSEGQGEVPQAPPAQIPLRKNRPSHSEGRMKGDQGA